MEEIWKPVPGYEGLYEVSNLGRIKVLDRIVACGRNGKGTRVIPGKILNIHPHPYHGYMITTLSCNTVKKSYRVHRLVAMVFIPNPDNLPEVNHKDEDKTNNRADNLEWCAAKYNCNYGTRNVRRTAKRSRPVNQIDKNTGEIIRTWTSVAEAARANGYSTGGICNVANGVKWKKTYKGYIWRYA